MVPEDGLEPSRGKAPRDFKSLVSTYSTTQAVGCCRSLIYHNKVGEALSTLIVAGVTWNSYNRCHCEQSEAIPPLHNRDCFAPRPVTAIAR
jgi:hypothetical protein